MMLRNKTLVILSVVLLFTGLVLISSVPANNVAREGSGTNTQNYILPIHPENLSFAGEKVPLDLFWVKESFDREMLINAYWHSSTIQLIKRSKRFFPLISPILKEEGVPDDFKYLAMAESNLLGLVSPSGAHGFWQFMPATAKEYGLRIDKDIDERYHLELATRAACKYIKEARDTFDSWTLAAAAYNAGFNGIRRTLKLQKATSYYELDLNAETARYLFRILALKTIISQPEAYGFIVSEDQGYVPLRIKEISVNTAIPDLAEFAAQQDISYRALKEMNPWMRSNSLPAPGSNAYIISLPENKGSWYPN